MVSGTDTVEDMFCGNREGMTCLQAAIEKMVNGEGNTQKSALKIDKQNNLKKAAETLSFEYQLSEDEDRAAALQHDLHNQTTDTQVPSSNQFSVFLKVRCLVVPCIISTKGEIS